MIKIYIIDDHQFLITGLVTVLNPHEHIKIIGTFTNAADLKQQLELEIPDVLLLDLLMPDTNGKELVTELLSLYPQLKILVLTSMDTPAMVSIMMRIGCKGYVLKDANTDELVRAIEVVNNNEEYIQPSIKEQIVQHALKYKNDLDQKKQYDKVNLSPREKEMLKLIAEEYTTREIAEKLSISFRTVESHRYNLMQKLNVKNTVGLIKVAIQLGFIESNGL